MNQNMLRSKAFGALFGGGMLFYNFTLLPLIIGSIVYMDSALLPEKDLVALVPLGMTGLTVVAFFSALDLVRTTLRMPGRQRRKEFLLHILEGRSMMLYFNPVGWLVCVGYFLFWKRVLVPLNKWLKDFTVVVKLGKE